MADAKGEVMAKHTPGPWETKPETDYVPAQVWANGINIADVFGEDRMTRKANARLIAAAPELLEAGDAMLSALADYFLECRIADVIEGLKKAGDNLAEAIRKAKGE